MKDKVQREKADLKLQAIYDIIERLIDYNGIANYDNIKPYTIDIDYYYDYENKCYKYYSLTNDYLDACLKDEMMHNDITKVIRRGLNKSKQDKK